MDTNSRAEAFKSAFGCSSRPSYQSSSFGWQQQRGFNRRSQPYASGSRIPKNGPKPLSTSREIVLPTHSASRTEAALPTSAATAVQALPKNARLNFLDKSPETPLKKTKFVAMPSQREWDKGYRPGWMLSETRQPPEKFEEGMKMYRIYLETGEVVYPKKSVKVDTTKQTASSYMNKYSNSKQMKKQ